jgi:uncharacterized RDD family membrane protein YckC
MEKACSSCEQAFAPEDLAVFGEHSVCAACQPAFVQTYRQGMVGTVAPTEFHYAGFWIRFCAQLIDFIITGAFAFLLGMGMRLVFGPPETGDSPVVAYVQIIVTGGTIFYYCYFWTHSGATPGKMLFSLKVIDEEGGPVRLGQAVKRWFSEGLSGVLLGYGYMKAGWSPEKRSLHDGIAGTRVIYTR